MWVCRWFYWQTVKATQSFGIDIDEKKIQDLTECNSYIDDVANDDLKNSSAQWTLDPKIISNAQAVIICVPTPVNHDKTPDLSPVKGAVKMIAPHLVTGTLVVLESTVNPGVSDEIVAPMLAELTGKKLGTEILLAHCPERINPGDPDWQCQQHKSSSWRQHSARTRCRQESL